jgi:broad specificity phosphatase PhoE
LAALNDIGIAEMIEAGKRLSETDAEVILSSPYTRALQSSAIVAKETGLTTVVVHDLHEWIPDTTFQYGSYKELKLLFEDFKQHKGVLPEEVSQYAEYTRWEPLASVKERVRTALLAYAQTYQSAIVMAHGMVLQSLFYQEHYLYGEIKVIDFDEHFKSPVWPLEL